MKIPIDRRKPYSEAFMARLFIFFPHFLQFFRMTLRDLSERLEALVFVLRREAQHVLDDKEVFVVQFLSVMLCNDLEISYGYKQTKRCRKHAVLAKPH